jgi:deazaflavin-dependent oxidoreductase (nitroreductase family)
MSYKELTQSTGSDQVKHKMENGSLVPYPKLLLRFAGKLPLFGYQFGLGGLLNLGSIMVLTTRGRRTGLARHVPVEYRRHGSKIYIVSVWGPRTDWYQNLLANPQATIQLGHNAYGVTASVVEDAAEALRVLYLFRRFAPARYDALLGRIIESEVNTRTLPNVSSQFTIMRLDITGTPGLPIVANVGWWPLVVLGTAVITAAGFTRFRRDREG